MIVACLGDSITAGSPLWDPDPVARARIGEPDERSQWQWWAAHAAPELDFRNHGVYGERTDQIAARFDGVVGGAALLIVQGGINDVVQGRPVEEAARNLAGMIERGRALGLQVAVADVLPWNNGDARAAKDITRLNQLVRVLADELGVPLLPFHDTLADPQKPHRMRDEWTDDGDHPSVEGHRLLGERAFRT
ncbi:MAG: GDSL-type esterase/lipase family protein [Actinomycetota bacterium]|nr:GDSL-type esterase/lipase family protein [Actinomycetota bacterium]